MRDLANRLDLCSINTATLGHREKISTVIDAVARHGYGAICPWRRDLQDENVTAIARQIRDARLTVSGYCRSTYFPALTRQDLEANIADNIKAVTDAATPAASEEEVRTLFVSGLPSDVTERELYLIFNRCEGFDNSHLYAAPLFLTSFHWSPLSLFCVFS